MRKNKKLLDVYCFSGYKTYSIVAGIFGDSHALVIKLRRLGKKQFVALVVAFTTAITIVGGEE